MEKEQKLYEIKEEIYNAIQPVGVRQGKKYTTVHRTSTEISYICANIVIKHLAAKDKRIEELEKELAEAKRMVTIATEDHLLLSYQDVIDLDNYCKTHNINQ